MIGKPGANEAFSTGLKNAIEGAVKAEIAQQTTGGLAYLLHVFAKLLLKWSESGCGVSPLFYGELQEIHFQIYKSPYVRGSRHSACLLSFVL